MWLQSSLIVVRDKGGSLIVARDKEGSLIVARDKGLILLKRNSTFERFIFI